MNRKLANAILNCFAPDARGEAITKLGDFRLADWKRTLYWLDWSGLALYLSHVLETDVGNSSRIPGPVLERLRQNRIDNVARVDHMLMELDAIGRGLESEGVRYAVLKGLSLVPHVCPDASLRHQSDFDLLLSRSDLQSAHRALSRLGYTRAAIKPGIFSYSRALDHLPRHEDMYKPGHYPIELHFSIWENDDRIKMQVPDDCLEQSRPSTWPRLMHPVLAPEDNFLLQCVHIVQHFVGYWIRPSWVLELGRVASSRCGDTAFWQILSERCLSQNTLAAVELALRLSECVFRFEFNPEGLARFQTRLTPAIRLWMNRYANEWVINPFPGSKTVILLQREFWEEKSSWTTEERGRLFPIRRPPSVVLRSSPNSVVSQRTKWTQLKWSAIRLKFHLQELPRYYIERALWARALKQLQRFSLPACVPYGTLKQH